MKQLIALLVVIPLVACTTSSAFTPQEFATRLQQQGPQQTLKQISPDEWQTLIAGVNKGDKEWLDLVPQFAESLYSIKDRQKWRRLSNELGEALVFSLLNNPAETLIMMQPIDSRIEELGDDNSAALVDFGSMMICAMPHLLDYDKASHLRYYHTLVPRLKKLGKLAEPCLHMLTISIEESFADEARGAPAWGGAKSWYP